MYQNTSKLDFSIIVPLWVDSKRFYEDLTNFNGIDNSSYELILVHDSIKVIPDFIKERVKNLRIVCTELPSTGPAEKRDFASKLANGRYLVFIDDDAYPDENWLNELRLGFSDRSVVAVGGPGITPLEDSFLEKVSGKVYESYFCSGLAQNRFVRKREMFVTDWPAYNLAIRKEIFDQIGGFNVKYYGGEDTFLCMKLINLGKIKYLPNAFVFHHRRPVFLSLFKQIYNIGKHRGYFFKKYPQNSRKFFYTIPTFLTVGLVSLIFLSFFSIYFFYTLVILLILSLVMSFMSIASEKDYSFYENLKLKLLGSFGIIMVHISYGTAFLDGLLTKNLER